MSNYTDKLLTICSNIGMAISSLFWKKDASVVLVGAWHGSKFADNSRYLYQYLSDNKANLGLTHVVWVTANENVCQRLNDMGYEAYLFGSKESIKFHKKARYHIVCNSVQKGNKKYAGADGRVLLGDIENEYSWRAKKVNLWHGIGGVKAIEYESNVYRDRKAAHPQIYKIAELLRMHSAFFRKIYYCEGGWGDAYYLGTTPAECDKLKRKFMIPDNRIIMSGYPRNCQCPRLTAEEKDISQIISAHKHSVLYLPTFRKGTKDFDFRVVGDQIAPYLNDDDILWIQKGHSADQLDLDYSYNGKLLNLSADFDINTITPIVNVVVTDYSSSMLDGQYHHKPIILYVPDFEEYKEGCNGFLPEADEIIAGCGYMYKDIGSLANGIKSALDNPSTAMPESYAYISNKYWGEEKSLKQIWDDILASVEK